VDGPYHDLENPVLELTHLFWGRCVGWSGLGTLGFHERNAQEMCADAGFGSVRRLPIENPFNNLYEITP
jgi:hypothetical protein